MGPSAATEPSIAFDLPSTLRAPATARRIIDSLRDPIGEPEHDDLTLLLSEVISNSVRHAGLRPGDRIKVRLSYAHGWVHAEVLDPGSGFERPRDVDVDPVRSDGYGLLLLTRLSTGWGAERLRDGMRVWFEIGAPRPLDPSRSPDDQQG